MSQSFPESMAAPMGEKLKLARLAKGLSTREVASSIAGRFSLTHATISNYEAGRTTPTMGTLTVLADFYERPLNWFFESGRILANIHYRNLKSRTKVSDIHRFEAQSQRWLEAYWLLEEKLGQKLRSSFPDFRADSGETGRSLAERLRKLLDYQDRDAVPRVADLFATFGLRAIEMPTDLAIDGFAALFGGEYAIVLNPAVAADRCRMNAAHELGHVLFRDCDREHGHGDSTSEKRAFEFASHLLLPQSRLKEAFEGRSMVRLVKFKEYYGISLQAMIYRAAQSEIIEEPIVKWLWIEFAKRGWKKSEPGFVRPDRATRFEDLLASAIGEQRLSWSSAARIMRVTEEELYQRMSLALGGAGRRQLEEGEEVAEEEPAILKLFGR